MSRCVRTVEQRQERHEPPPTRATDSLVRHVHPREAEVRHYGVAGDRSVLYSDTEGYSQHSLTIQCMLTVRRMQECVDWEIELSCTKFYSLWECVWVFRS